MGKWITFNKILQLKISSCVIFLLCLIGVVQFFASYGQYNYDHIPKESILHNIYYKTNPNLIIAIDKPNCHYDAILQSTTSIPPSNIAKTYEDFMPTGLVNGSYIPENCNPLISIAVIVTYRKRQSQLDTFIQFMHNFLRKQGIHYCIYVVEQQDDKVWNKGLLYNVGAKHAIADKFPCLILHDVDLLPLDLGNLYACLYEPRHMSASIDKFRYVLTYDCLVGGALAIRSNQYIAVNGFSNRFHGWGGEDDDLSARIAAKKLKILRFPRELSRYTMLVHDPEVRNVERKRIMSENHEYFDKEGLNTARHTAATVTTNKLFTLIGVKT